MPVKEELLHGQDDLFSAPPVSPARPLVHRASSHISLASSTAPTPPSRASPATMTEEDQHMADPPNAMQSLGVHSGDLIKAIQKLEALSIDSALPSLPKFCVIGDQSAGKSSIIEGICDITLPRAEGTCTRCPFKITTTATPPGSEWTCRVSLYTKYRFMRNEDTKKHGSPYEKWSEMNDLDIYPFTTVQHKHQLGLALQRAQLATLNPGRNPADFINYPRERIADDCNKGTGFSPNIVNLEISAPRLPELSFYDLPGAINTVSETALQYLPKFVQDLLSTYIRDKQTFIVFACPSNLEIETSTALRFLYECQATDRTMCVLTKPDLMDDSRATFAQRLLAAEPGFYTFGGGCYVTKQPSQTEIDRGVSYEQARRSEAEFFSGTPWSTTLARYSSRFGISNVQAAIAEKLKMHILTSLPDIQERVQARKAYVDEQLSAFPKKDVAPYITVHTSVSNVSAEIKAQINSDRADNRFRPLYKAIFVNLRQEIAKAKPELCFDTPGYEKPSISLDSDEEESPSKKQRTGNGTRGITVTPVSAKSTRTRATPSTKNGVNGFSNRILLLDDIKARFDSASETDTTTQVSLTVVRSLVIDMIKCWRGMVNRALNEVEKLFSEMLQSTIEATLVQYLHTDLYREVSNVSKTLLAETFQSAVKIIKEVVASELHRPHTYTRLVKEEEIEAQLLKTRRLRRVDEHFDPLESNNHKVPNKKEQRKNAEDIQWVEAELGVDDYKREVKALAMPLAYYEYASAHLVDSVSKLLERGLLHAYGEGILGRLLEGLHAGQEDRCALLLSEDPAREQKRLELESESSKLEQAMRELDGLHALHS